MASNPPALNLPVFYKNLVPLNSQEHQGWSFKGAETASYVANQHAVPVTIDEFPLVQRHYPIIFTSNENPVPLAMMGMNEGVNVLFDDKGMMHNPIYVPAYIRRYPFMLARLQPNAKELSLCFDSDSGQFGEFDDGQKLFDNDQPSQFTKDILSFCENYEQSWQKTIAFVAELQKLDLLMDGELKIENPNLEKPFLYRGFRMVNEEKLRELRGDELRKLNQNGALPLIYAHLLSTTNMREIFAMQAEQGKLPEGALKNGVGEADTENKDFDQSV